MRTAHLRWSTWFAAVLLGTFVSATAAVPLRITAAVDDTARTALPGSVSPRLKTATDLGAAPADRQLTMSIRFSMTEAQQSALNGLLAELQNPSSPNFHHWLTPEQFAAQFGLAPADIAAVSTWLTQQGFTVTGTGRGGQFITFTGTVAQAQQAFATPLHRVQVAGVEHFANMSAPSVPAAIAQVTLAVTGLDDFSPRPRAVVRSVAAPTNTASSTGGVQPQFTSQLSGNTYIAPGDIYKIYDVNPALTSSINGSGVTIAVVGQADISLADIAAFRSVSGLSVNAPTVKLYGADPGSSSSVDVTEAEMAVEWAGAAAPAASILYVNSNAVIDGSLTSAIDNNVAPIIADIYGECEAYLGASKIAYYNQLLAQAAAQGITITAPSGNAGATDCDYGAYPAQSGAAIDFPGSSPYVTAVGGTEFYEGSGTYWSASNGTYQASALSYIPEIVWNETSSSTGLLAAGGGASLYFPKPSWQVGTGVPQDLSRDTPDVSLSASIYHDGYLICVAPYCAVGYATAGGYLDIAGGTDLTSAEFAGFMALVVQKTGGRVGVANNTLYALANSSAYASSVFHDITAGSNASPCTSGSTGCGSSGVIGFNAGSGFDLATGWGSVDVYNMVTDWPLVTPLATTPAGATSSVTNLSANPSSVTAGTSITLTATVGSGNNTVTSTPTGTVSFAVDGVAVGSSATLSGGVATYTLATAALSSGSHLIQAAYSGDATYSGSKGAFTINVASATAPDFTLTPSTTSVTVASGGISQGIVFTVTPVNGFTGTVSFQLGAPSGFGGNIAFSSSSVNVSGTSPVTTTLTIFAYTPLVKTGVGQLSSNAHGGWQRAAGTGIAFASLLFLLAPRRRKLRLPALFAVLLLAGTVGLSGCSNSNGGSSNQTSHTNTPAGTYTLTVSATGTVNGAAVTHSSVVNLTVQ